MTRVLIVEDDLEQARALQRTFATLRPDLAISIAANGVAATKLLSEQTVDLVLTDLRMPEMDGFELLSWLYDHRPNIPVFTMSAYDVNGAAARMSSLGHVDHFSKPLDERALLSRIGETLSQSVHGVVHNVSLASLLQLLEMERKSCRLSVSCDDKCGVLCIDKGALVSAQTADIEGQAAAIAIIAWANPSIAISRLGSAVPRTIQSSLGFIVMEAMRIQDENARAAGYSEKPGSVWPIARRTWRPTTAPHENGNGSSFASPRPLGHDLLLQSGTRALAVVDTATGNVLSGAARDDCPVGELARMAAQLLLQEAATLELCNKDEGVEELVLSTSSRCDVIRPLGKGEFAMLVFAPEETNLVIARAELDQFILAHSNVRASGR
jgi:CheY-like chemotaxis protein